MPKNALKPHNHRVLHPPSFYNISQGKISYNIFVKIQKVSQIELVKYIDELDEKLNDKKIKDILYKQYLNSNKNTRKTKTDKRYKIIAALTRDNFDTQIGDTTVWRILKIKGKSKKAFEEI